MTIAAYAFAAAMMLLVVAACTTTNESFVGNVPVGGDTGYPPSTPTPEPGVQFVAPPEAGTTSLFGMPQFALTGTVVNRGRTAVDYTVVECSIYEGNRLVASATDVATGTLYPGNIWDYEATTLGEDIQVTDKTSWKCQISAY